MCNKKIEYADLVGVPFVSQGRSKDGMDCYGLTQEIFRRCGDDIGEYWVDAFASEQIDKLIRNATATRWEEIDYKNGAEIPVPALVAISFNTPPGIVNHTAVYIGNGRFLHTREKIGVCVDRLDSPAWRKKIEGIYKFKGGEESGQGSFYFKSVSASTGQGGEDIRSNRQAAFFLYLRIH